MANPKSSMEEGAIPPQPAGTVKGKENVPALDLGVVWVIMTFVYEYEAQGSHFISVSFIAMFPHTHTRQISVM